MTRFSFVRRAASVLALTTLLGAAGCGDDSASSPGMSVLDVTTSIRALSDDDPDARKHAAVELRAGYPSSARAVPVLVAALEDDDPGVRGAASEALMVLGARGAEILARFLLDEDDPSRRSAIEAMKMIARLGARVTAKDLAGAGMSDARAGMALMGLMPSVGQVDAETVFLAQVGPDGEADADVRELASAALATRGARAAVAWRREHAISPGSETTAPAAVVELLSDSEPMVRVNGVRLLDGFDAPGSAATAALAKIAAGDPEVARLASWGISKSLHSAMSSDEDKERLRAELTDPDPNVRLSAAVALCRIAPDDEEARAVLAEALTNPQAHAINTALRAIASTGPAARSLAPAVVDVLMRSEGWTSVRALETLAAIDPAPVAAVPVLVERLRAWANLPPPPTKDALRKLVETGSRFDAGREPLFRVLEMLARIGPPAAETVRLLHKLTRSEDPRIRYRAALALRRIERE